MSADPKPPFPLPDLPRAPMSTVGLLVARWLEWDDWTAAQKLPDALRDAGRDDDAQALVRIVAKHIHPQLHGTVLRNHVLGLLAFDVFDWNAYCEQTQLRRAKAAADLRKAIEEGALANRVAFFGEAPEFTVAQAQFPVEPPDLAHNVDSPDPAQQLIGFAALRGFVPVAESQTPLTNEAGVEIGTDHEITFRLRTLGDDDGTPELDDTDLYQPGPDDGPGDSV